MAEFLIATAAGLTVKIVSLSSEEVIRIWNLKKDLKNLRQKSDIAVVYLNAALNTNITPNDVVVWLGQLEEVANDAQVFLDKLAYKVTRTKVEHRYKFWDSIPSITALKYRLKIKSLTDSFDEAFKVAMALGIQRVQPRDIHNMGAEPPCVDISNLIVGRDKDISNLVEIVCKDREQDLPVVAIEGEGGQGKTTLARAVFHSDDVIKAFTKRMWITVSDDFSSINILKGMAESLTSTPSLLSDSNELVNELQQSLKGEKFLLVLDDIWNENSKFEEFIKSLLQISGVKGTIVVTTRPHDIQAMQHYCIPHRLQKLEDDDSYDLFKKIAFQVGGVSETEEFAALGRSMVERCGGLPLAIKSLGGMLSMMSEQEWRRIRNNREIWTVEREKVQFFLRLSYENLPYSSLKQCFMHCSIIPRKTRIDKDELIQQWMALGFLLPPLRKDVLMEDIGNKYFNILLSHFLLQDIEMDEFGNIQSCKMHDLVHDLALDLSKDHSVTVKTGLELNHVSNATYVRLDNQVSDRNPKFLKKNFEKVRLLYARGSVFHDALASIKYLTVLVLSTDGFSGKGAGELPKSLENMKYIKHLDISCLRSKLPSYITKLYNLQTLRVWELEELPKKFCNLINLRHLYIKSSSRTRCFLKGIERFTCLQTLPYFVVSRDQNCLVEQLHGLQNIKGKVNLYGLGDVLNTDEAMKAKLDTKSNIQSLLLNWKIVTNERVNNGEDTTESESNNKCEIDGLKPHENLKELIIEYFMGNSFASWMVLMTNLVKITLNDCKRVENIPSLGHFPKLREIEINRMVDVTIIGRNGSYYGTTDLYPSLIKLSLCNLPNLQKWMEPDASSGSGHQRIVQVFPKLQVLSIKSCSVLTGMPNSQFLSIKKLIIYKSDLIRPSLEDLCIRCGGGASSSSVSHDNQL